MYKRNYPGGAPFDPRCHRAKIAAEKGQSRNALASVAAVRKAHKKAGQGLLHRANAATAHGDGEGEGGVFPA